MNTFAAIGTRCAPARSVAQPVRVTGKDGWSGIVHSWSDKSGEVAIRLDRGGKLILPTSTLTEQPDGSYYAPLSLEEIDRAADSPAKQSEADVPPVEPEAAPVETSPEEAAPIVIPIIHEELEIGKRKVDTGGVRIHKSVHEEERTVDVPLIEEHVQVERVRIDKAVEGPVPVRHVGDTIVVPVLEEVLVVQKQLRLVEELHIRKTRTEKHQPQTVTLRKEEATMERLEGEPRGPRENEGGTDDLRAVR
jgi:uncharacterized protein (TIGR02271 family)